MTSDRRIKSRIAARNAAVEIFSLLSWEDGTGADFAESFLKEMRDLLPTRVKTDPPKQESYSSLAATVMPFGEYEGCSLENVPTGYLDWLCREQEEFYKRLREFLRHPERPNDP